MYCSILITVQHPCICNLECPSCDTVIRLEQYIPDTPAICKLESSACDTVISMERYIPDTPAYVSWNPLFVILWSEWSSTYLTPLNMQIGILFFWYCDQNGTVQPWHRDIRYVLFHSDYSITSRGFQLTYCRGVRYVLFQSDHSITRRAF
jgi:hypothetical protein